MASVIGYLHIGDREHGVRRYGHVLARTASQREDLEVVEAEVTLTSSVRENRRQIMESAALLNHADVVHFQYNRAVWGGKGWDLFYIWLFTRYCRRPLGVTVHDVYPESGAGRIVYPGFGSLPAGTGETRPHPLIPILRKTKGIAFRITRPIRRQVAVPRVWQRLAETAALIFVCSEEEAQRLEPYVPPSKVRIIPHFVEERNLSTDRSESRQVLGLSSHRVVTLLGWIHGRKGHVLLVEAMAHLPDDVFTVFAGQATQGSHGFTQRLVARAREIGVDHRLRITGYLPEPQLERYLIATDLGVCPFSGLSASGSLSTWISAGKPILASDLPQIAEYNRLEPGTIRTFSPYTPMALADAIRQSLDREVAAIDPAVLRLQGKLRVPHLLNRHIECYKEVVRNEPSPGGLGSGIPACE